MIGERMVDVFDQDWHDDHSEVGLDWRVAGVTQLLRKKPVLGLRRVVVVRPRLGMVVVTKVWKHLKR